MNKFAPVLISTLNRFTHFLRCVESLAECTHAQKTDLYIALDYPLAESHWEGYKNIANYINDIKGFKSIVIIRRDNNFGAQKNYFEAQGEIFRNYDRIIVSEDDNEFSPNFLDYINKGLDNFEWDENVLAICGHRPLINIPVEYKSNYYYARHFSGWGIGFWRDRCKDFAYNTRDLVKLMQNKDYKKELKTYHQHVYYGAFDFIRNKETKYGDGAILLDMVKYNKYCVFPTIAKVRNHGHDGSGVHSGYNAKYAKQEIDTNNEFEYSDNVPLLNKKIAKSLRNYFKVNAKQRAKIAIKNLLFKLNIEVRRINKI